jgi:transposase
MRTAALEDRRVREKFSCRDCEAITEPPAPARPIPRGLAGPSLLAMVLAAVYTVIETCKFTDVDPHAWLADVLARLPGLPLFFALARPAPLTIHRWSALGYSRRAVPHPAAQCAALIAPYRVPEKAA